MNHSILKIQWQAEQAQAFQGWDFSHISGRWGSEPVPWSYGAVVSRYLKSTDTLLDIGTGGGEFLLSRKHPHRLTSVTESYPPNFALCRKTLSPLGIAVAQTYEDNKLPFANESFDIVINRHAAYAAAEAGRVLRRGGCFITQQVGGANDFSLSQRLIEGFVPQFPKHTLQNCLIELKRLGFSVIQAEEAFPQVWFYDVGALVYFAKIIQWEFPNFSVERCFAQLCRCQEEIAQKGCVAGIQHRFLIVAIKS